MSSEEIHGQLFVCVKECRKVSTKGGGAFCILQLDKQQVQTHGVKWIGGSDFSYEAWDEGFSFDITNTNATVTLSLYSTPEVVPRGQLLDNSEGKCLGAIVIPIVALTHQKPVDQFFKLTSKTSTTKDNVTGEVHLKLQYTTITKKVGPEDFEPLRVVGRGSFAKVMLVRKVDTGRTYAMKVIKKDSVIKHNAVKHTLSERNVLMRIINPFIVSLKYSFQTDDKLYMILDYIAGGELFYHLSEAERFTEQRARFYTAEILQALGYLHKMNIVYRDLKPENLLLDMNGHICLTDFGLCKEGLGYGYVTHTFCGSPEYLAPEIFLGTGYDKAVDWWAMGTLLYEMLSGLPPFFSEDIDEMNERILTEPLTFPKYFSEEARSLLRGLLERNPKKRLGGGSGDAEDIKKHPFFKSIDWAKLEAKEIEPPFRPGLKSETDVRFFDPESTSEVARHSFIQSYGTGLSQKDQDLFRGFSYVAPEERRMMMRRRTSSGSRNPPRRMSRSGSNTSTASNLSSNSPFNSGNPSPTTTLLKEGSPAQAPPPANRNSLTFLEQLHISYDSDPDRLSTLSPTSVEGESPSPHYPSAINNVHTANIAIPNGNAKAIH